jgi:hypothetical protein
MVLVPGSEHEQEHEHEHDHEALFGWGEKDEI